MEIVQHRPHHNILEVFAEEKAQEHGFLRVSAPMVRYSKMEFRQLLRQHGVKLSFTPMIIADSFNSSQKARENEFTTCAFDQPVIAQFAAQNAAEFVQAAKLIYPYVDGVDLNCGCPQSWAIAKGYGCGLLRQPELVQDIVKSVRRTLPTDLSISLKIRLLNGAGEQGVRATVELARQLEKCGATFLSIHGRTMWQRISDPLNVHAMAEVKQSLQIPLVVNGNVRCWQDACELHAQTRADGVMAARGLLTNPALFNPIWSGCDIRESSLICAQQWLDIATRAGDNIHFQCFHHHLSFMWSSHMKRSVRLEFNNFTKKQEIYNFFDDRFGIRPTPEALKHGFDYTKCSYTHCAPPSVQERDATQQEIWRNANDTDGKFFSEFNEEVKKDDANQDDDVALGDSFFAELN